MLREDGVSLMLACNDCGSLDVRSTEEPDDDWYAYLVTMSTAVPGREHCEDWLAEKDISEEIALDTARDMHNKLRYSEKTGRWNPGGYLTIYATWQSWCRNAIKRQGNSNGHRATESSMITKKGGNY